MDGSEFQSQEPFYPDETAARVDQAVIKLLHQAEKQAGQLISDHRARVQNLVEMLELEETLNA